MLVLFVLEAPRFNVQQFAAAYAVPADTFAYFTDLPSLMAVPKADLLTTPHFIWGGDGRPYSLSS